MEFKMYKMREIQIPSDKVVSRLANEEIVVNWFVFLSFGNVIEVIRF